MILPLSPKPNTLYFQAHDGKMDRCCGLQLYSGNIMYGHLDTETNMFKILEIKRKIQDRTYS